VSSRDVPSYAKSIIKPELLRWDDFATWNEAGGYCDWALKTRVFTDSFTCSGRNQFLEDSGGTRVLLTGQLQISMKDIPGVPRFLAGTLGPQVEKFITSLITPNLEQVNRSIERFMDEKAS
jgi:hypothetical protein